MPDGGWGQVEGTLTSKNAGGNSTHPTFMVNPQYHLRIHPPKHATSPAARKADVSLTMQIGRDVPVNIAVAWSQGHRIFEYANLLRCV
jgi:calpain-7